MTRTRAVLLAAAGFGLAGCPGNTVQTSLSAADSLRVITEVETATWAFYAADTARNAEAVIDLLWPEYVMFVDSTRVGYAEVAAGARGFLPTLALFHTAWTDLQVIPLGLDAAVSAFRFRDSIVTRDGNLIQNAGTTSFVWRRRGSEWRLLYGDAHHFPVVP